MKRTLSITEPVPADIEYTVTEYRPRNVIVSQGGAWRQLEDLAIADPSLARAVKDAVVEDYVAFLKTVQPRDFWRIGTTKEYLEGFRDVAVVPEEVAKFWLAFSCPGHQYLSDWTNKGFVLIGHNERGLWLALYLHDGIFYISEEKS